MKFIKSFYRKYLFVQKCLSMLGLPYRWGGSNSIDGFDCSGAVQDILMSFGVDPKGDQTADELFKHFDTPDRCTHLSKPRLGALCFYGTNKKIVHVGISLDNKVMFEFGGGNSETVNKTKAAERNAEGRIRPIRSRPDFKYCLMPSSLDSYLKGGE